jgi:hypothetical protein
VNTIGSVGLASLTLAPLGRKLSSCDLNGSGQGSPTVLATVSFGNKSVVCKQSI